MAGSSLVGYNVKKARAGTLWARADCDSREADGPISGQYIQFFSVDFFKLR